MNDQFSEIRNSYANAISFYNSKKGEMSIEVILESLLEVTFDKDESIKLAQDVNSSIDRNNSNYLKIQEGKENGLVASNFVSDKLIQFSDNLPNKEKFNRILSLFLGEGEKNIKYSSSHQEYIEHLFKRFINSFNQDAIINEEINDLDLEEINDLDLEVSLEHEEFKDFYDSELSSKTDSDIKKLISVATIILNKKGILDNLNSDQRLIPETIPFIVDKSLTYYKIAKTVGENPELINVALEQIIDRYAAIFITIVERFIKNSSETLGQSIGAFIGAVFGPVGQTIGALIGKVVGSLVGNVVTKFISKGITAIATIAKETINTVISIVGETINKVINFIFG